MQTIPAGQLTLVVGALTVVVVIDVAVVVTGVIVVVVTGAVAELPVQKYCLTEVPAEFEKETMIGNGIVSEPVMVYTAVYGPLPNPLTAAVVLLTAIEGFMML